jgi:hypothetical protein
MLDIDRAAASGKLCGLADVLSMRGLPAGFSTSRFKTALEGLRSRNQE